MLIHPFAVLALPLLLLAACGNSVPGTGSNPGNPHPVAAERPAVVDTSPASGTRTEPDPLCPDDYQGSTGQLQYPPIPYGSLGPDALHGGTPADAATAARLPAKTSLRSASQSYTADHAFALLDGRIYVKANAETTGVQEPWREVLVPRCLQGQASQISADGTVLVALNAQRELYTLDAVYYAPGAGGWTRRWGPPFWTDNGESMPEDVTHWATSHFSGSDRRYVDRAGREHAIAGILTVYGLRGDGLRIVYMDPWLPSDESREVCGPERGTLAMAGLSGSGSSVMVVTRDGRIFTRLYEFDVSGANTVFLDYSWQDQEGAAMPKIQLPAPDWVEHARIPGRHGSQPSLRQLGVDTRHRDMRVAGWNASGSRGYWQKDLADTSWQFVADASVDPGSALPLPGPYHYRAEDAEYRGTVDGYAAVLADFNPYCSPASLALDVSGTPLNLLLHSSDGLRQERRARGLDANPHVYRSALEVPLTVWNNLTQQAPTVRDFITRHFGSQRFLTGPLSATPGKVMVQQPCWEFTRASDVVALPAPYPDPGMDVAEARAQEEEGRTAAACGY